MVIWIPSFMLTAVPKYRQLGPIMASQHKEWNQKIKSFQVQRWAKCCMKAPISQVLLKTFLFKVYFSKRYLKTPWWTFLMKNQPQTDAFVAFVKSLPSVPSTSFLLTTAWLKSLQQCFWFTLLLCSRVSYNGIL